MGRMPMRLMAKMAMLLTGDTPVPRSDDMTNREHIQQQLSAYIDGELDAADASAVEQALAREPDLARELEQLKASRELLRRLPVEHAPEDFASRVLAQTERRHLVHLHAPAGQSINWLRYFVVAAVALIAISVALVTIVGIYSAGKADRNLIATRTPAKAPTAGEEAYGLFDKSERSETAKDGELRGGAEQADRKAEAGQTTDNNVLICTDDLPKARRELERELGKNAIQFKSHGSGDEEAVVVADVDSSQVSRLNKVISDLRSSNKGAELSGRQLRRARCDEQASAADNMKRKSSGTAWATAPGSADGLGIASTEGQKQDESAKKELSKGAGQAGGGKPAQKLRVLPAPSATACKASDSGGLAKSAPSHQSPAKPCAGALSVTAAPATTCPASDKNAVAVVHVDKGLGEHLAQSLPAAPARAVNATSQSRFGYARNQSNQLALRVQITLQYHPALTEGSGAGQNQRGGATGQNVNQSSQPCPADNAASQPDDSQQNLNR